MKRFSKIQKINKKNLSKVPNDKPGVFRIINEERNITYIGKTKSGRMDEQIGLLKGRFMKDTKFQYRIVENKEDVDRIEREEIMKL